ncbi:probable arginine--tRNA ligase, mitochondrial [Nilaparvata lugens]|uniref:probable arginine--tRNA ligase, mitochondrial n=1 Tax=Nilaparvata lugens TaxID=108931 RepID=UPI00193D171D|nr:probable arginine--tRNA ligase, mitochondrial [Nilaparvata lugens]
MAVAKYKHIIGRKVLEVLKKHNYNINPASIENAVVLNKTQLRFELPVESILKNNVNEAHCNDLLNITIKEDCAIKNVAKSTSEDHRRRLDEDHIHFNIDESRFVKDVLQSRDYFHELDDLSLRKSPNTRKKVLVEYSSPNVAKPFHMGNFRSTIIGNYLSNIHDYFQHDVVRLTYLGDWGKQFGLLQIGLDDLGLSEHNMSQDKSRDKMLQNPIETLFKAYVAANQRAELDSDVLKRANEIFHSMETGRNEEVLKRWEIVRKVTVNELSETYRRLGVRFDDYDWESNYPASTAAPHIESLRNKGKIRDEDGKQVFVLDCGKTVPLLKSDGSSLYLTRDVVAAITRKARYNFDETIYVVDFSQEEHFVALRNILAELDPRWTDLIKHVKFGRVRGMSTRKGEVVFLKDILDEARSIMAEKQEQSATTKDDLPEYVSDVLGISAVMVNDLKQRRMKDYNFDWNSALHVKGDSGIKLQYTHCRLVSLEENCGFQLDEQCFHKCDTILDPVVIQLVHQIARFDDVMEESFKTFESFHIVNYLFKLCNTINKAMKSLPVKDAPNRDIALQRLLVFHSARIVLNRGMKVLGLKPLDKM